MSTQWNDLDGGMFFLLRSTSKPRPFGLRPRFKDYAQDKAMCKLIQVVNVHRVDGKISQMYIKIIGTRNFWSRAWIKADSNIHTTHVKHPDLYFKDATITIVK